MEGLSGGKPFHTRSFGVGQDPIPSPLVFQVPGMVLYALARIYWNPMKGFQRLRNKIILSVMLYLITLGIAGYVFLNAYLLRAVLARAERLDRMNLETVKNRLDRDFDNLFALAVLCANDPAVVRLVSLRYQDPREKLMESLNVQEKMNTYLKTSPAGTYVDRFILADGEDMLIHAAGRQTGEPNEWERFLTHPLYLRYIGKEDAARRPQDHWVSGFGQSLIPLARNPDSYGIIFPIYSSYTGPDGFIYIEAGLDMVTAAFREFSPLGGLRAFTVPVDSEGGAYISPTGKLLTTDTVPVEGLRFRRGGRSFRVDILPLENAGLILHNEVDITELRRDDREVFYAILVVIAGALLAAGGLALILSVVLTRPIRRLIKRIEKIGGNDLSPDPEIEKSSDEIGEIGRALNTMSGNIARLLKEMEENFRQQRNTEIALLQTRINPHFLYNTLDSIQWMAKIQKNTGIADITRSLINLLRNIAGHSGGLITVEDELRLLEDYTAVMSIRFMGIFSLENRIDTSLYTYLIPKLTLQPLVENAIIHGIAPSGIFSTIVLTGRLESSFLVLTVEDSGLGIKKEKLQTILDSETGNSGTSLNTIGVGNVNERLKLVYGEGAGLMFESEEGKFTRVTVRLAAQTAAKEGKDVPGTAGR